MKRKVLITGGSGFIGRHLMQTLVAQRFKVHLLVRNPRKLGMLPEGVLLHHGGLEDAVPLAQAADGAELVFHLAGLTRAKSEAEFHSVNADGVKLVLEACQRHAATRRFVLVSSLAAAGIGSPDHPRRESDPAAPRSAYGRSKLAGEVILQKNAAGIPWTICRPPIVYGPWDKDFLMLLRGAQRGWALLPSGPERWFSLVYGPDLAEALAALALEPAAAGEVFNVANAESWGHRAMVDAMGQALGCTPRKLILPRPVTWLAAAAGSLAQRFLTRPPILTLDKHSDAMAPGWVADTTKLQRLAPQLCTTALPAGLEQTVRWCRQRRWLD